VKLSDRDPSRLPGTFRSRVFVGGSYKVDPPGTALPGSRWLLEQIKNAVREAGLHPILADEFDVENADVEIHHDAVYLLHACRLAVFELSGLSGALMELERSVDYGTFCLVLHHDPEGEGWRLSRMLSSFVREHSSRIRRFGYTTIEAARDMVRNWLHEMLEQNHARR
jgi:hypothetical protein